MTGPRRQILQRKVISTKHPLLLTMIDLTMNPGRDPYMVIDTPSDELYNIYNRKDCMTHFQRLLVCCF